jgi:hypothetical protein
MVLFEPLDCFNVRDVATNRWRILTFQDEENQGRGKLVLV